MSEDTVISTQDLTKIYGHNTVVDRLNLQVPAHEITAFLGRNGAGKSTTIKMLLGITHPSSGTGTVLGTSILGAAQNRKARCEVAYVAEDKHLYSYMTVEQLVRFTKSFYPTWRPEIESR